MPSRNQMADEENCMVAFVFDSGKFSTFFHGKAGINAIMKGKELRKNKSKIVVSIGDVLNRDMCVDIGPYVISDELCSIHWNTIINPNPSDQGSNHIKHESMHDFPFVVVLEDVEKCIIQKIDSRLHKECVAYVGMTSINPRSTDQRKQFWKNTVRLFSLEETICTVFGEAKNGFVYEKEVDMAGYTIQYDGFAYDLDKERGILFSTRQSSFIHNLDQLKQSIGNNDSDRGRLNMNFALVKEVEIAGVEIWKSIEDINRVYLSKDSKHITVDYIFTSFYQAAQGTERLLKTLVELVSYIEKNADNKKTDELLVSHNHIALADYLEKKGILKYDTPCRKLLQILTTFYCKVRYSRYLDCANNELELVLLHEYGSSLGEKNYNEEFKKLYGKILGKISRLTYKAIDDLSSKIGIFVSELNTSSVACIVFWESYQENLYKSLLELENAKMEILWYLIFYGDRIKEKYPENIFPLSFEGSGINGFVTEMVKENLCETDVFSQVDEEYKTLKTKDRKGLKTRFDFLNYLFSNDGFTDHFFTEDFEN